MEDVAWKMFIGFCTCVMVALVVTGVVLLWMWLGWWTLIGMVGVFMALCLFYGVGHVIDTATH